MQLRRCVDDERGVTLVELVVTSGLLALVVAVVVTFFAGFSQTLNDDRASTHSATTAAIGMNELTRVVRSGTEIPVQDQALNLPVFIAAGREQVTLHAYLDTSSTDPAPVKVQFSINTGRELVETRWNSYVINTTYWAFYPSAASSRTIARKIVEPASGEAFLFTYYDSGGNALVPGQDGFIAASQLRHIAAVRISMTVQADITGRAAPVQLQNTVGIPNLGISRVGADR